MKTACIFLLAAACCTGSHAQIPASTPQVHFTGRTVTGTDGSISFDWTGTHFTTLLTGGNLSARISCKGEAYLNVFAGGNLLHTVHLHTADTLVNLVSGIGKEQTEITVQKRTEGEYGRITIHQFLTDKDGRLDAAPRPKRHIEFIGNSLTCGYGTESRDRNEPFKLATENCDKAYGAIVARYFGADYTLIAHSGQGAVRNYGDTARVSALCMRQRMMRTFDCDTLLWDGKGYCPQLVVINLGTNDFSTRPHPQEKEFVQGYLQLIRQVRTLYGKVPVLCVCPPTTAAPLDHYLEAVKKAADDPQVHLIHLTYKLYNDTTDLGASWHPNYIGQQKMALSLIPYISTLTGWKLDPNRTVR